ncbi:MAG: pyridoxamine 5'-phosphate oxidase family protein [Acidimicrobiia bacterium]
MHSIDIPPSTANGSLRSPDPASTRRALTKRSFATLATVSQRGRPHVAGVLYELVDDALFVSTLRSSRKARNIATNPHVAVSIPIRRLPLGPPSSVHFQATAEILAVDDRRVCDLVASGRLKAITGHGELDLPDGCILRIAAPATINTYGLGMRLLELIRNPLDAAGTTAFAEGA